jgi:hypothetical protein
MESEISPLGTERPIQPFKIPNSRSSNWIHILLNTYIFSIRDPIVWGSFGRIYNRMGSPPASTERDPIGVASAKSTSRAQPAASASSDSFSFATRATVLKGLPLTVVMKSGFHEKHKVKEIASRDSPPKHVFSTTLHVLGS